MEEARKILFVGGDERALRAAQVLSGKGFPPLLSGFETYGKAFPEQMQHVSVEAGISEADIIVLPLPYTRDGETVNAPFSEKPIRLKRVFAHSKGKVLLGGMLPEDENRIDYYDEIMVLENADVTAEAAIVIAGERSGNTFAGARALLLGYGRIGKALAGKLKSLGCSVTVAARKESDRALARLAGHSAIDSSDAAAQLERADYLFNTVPVLLIDEQSLAALPEGVPAIDLAGSMVSAHVLQAKGLPGKYAPIRAGAILAEAVERALKKGETV